MANIKERAVKVVVNELRKEIDEYNETVNTRYYDTINSWKDMMDAFGWDSEDAKEEIAYYLHDQKDTDLWLTEDEYELIAENEIVSYRQFANAVRKELFKKGA